LIVEREVQIAEAAGLPELHLPDAEFCQAIDRAVAADDDPEFCLVGPGRTVRDVVQGDFVAALGRERRRLRGMCHNGRAHVIGRGEALEAADGPVGVVRDALVASAASDDRPSGFDVRSLQAERGCSLDRSGLNSARPALIMASGAVYNPSAKGCSARQPQ